jgi:prepilin peptidase CpaA
MTLIFPLLAFLLLWQGAYTDLTERKIYNKVTATILLCFLFYASMEPERINFLINLLWAAVVFLFFFVGFIFRKIGGGDVKLATVTMLWAGPDYAVEYLVIMAFAGGAIGVISVNPITKYTWAGLQTAIGKNRGMTMATAIDSVPYGLAIAVGGSVPLMKNYLVDL